MSRRGSDGDNVVVEVARIRARQAIVIAAISAFVTITGLVIKEVIRPSLTPQEIRSEVDTAQQEVRSEVAAAQQEILSEVKSAQPEFVLHPATRTRTDCTQQLGKWQVCVLVTAGESHHNQACTCRIEPSYDPARSSEWQLRVDLDQNVPGFCNCRAGCFNGLRQAGVPTSLDASQSGAYPPCPES